MSSSSRTIRSIFRGVSAVLLASAVTLPAIASAKEPQPETVTVSSRALKDDNSKLCMSHKDAETKKTAMMCLTRDGWAAQGVIIIVK